ALGAVRLLRRVVALLALLLALVLALLLLVVLALLAVLLLLLLLLALLTALLLLLLVALLALLALLLLLLLPLLLFLPSVRLLPVGAPPQRELEVPRRVAVAGPHAQRAPEAVGGLAEDARRLAVVDVRALALAARSRRALERELAALRRLLRCRAR